MKRCLAFAALILATTDPAPISAQTGVRSHDCTVGVGYACDGMLASDERGVDPRDWIRVLVLWKGGASSDGSVVTLRAPRDTATARALYERFRNESRAAEDRDRALIGGVNDDGYWIAGYTWGRIGRGGVDTLYVLDQAYRVPVGDSAIVVLVDSIHTLTHTPRVVAALRIANRMTARAREKMWMSGDTTFIVRPRSPGASVPESILQHPTVRAFLGHAP